MQQKPWSGLSTAEAARDVARMEHNSDMPDGSVETPVEHAEKVGAALERFDEDDAHALLERLLGVTGSSERSVTRSCPTPRARRALGAKRDRGRIRAIRRPAYRGASSDACPRLEKGPGAPGGARLPVR
jgi:hypothetical protein